jgi:hypothetical protein
VSENLFHSKEKMIPANVVQEMLQGSHEQLAARVDYLVAENREIFVGDSDERVSRLATFNDHVLVATSSGKCFDVKLQLEDGDIRLGELSPLDVPVISSRNASHYMREQTLSAVDAILSGRLDEACDHLSILSAIQEGAEENQVRDFAHELEHIVDDSRPWRSVYGQQHADIRGQIADQLERIEVGQFEAKYRPMYETDDIPEEKFEDYREMVDNDIRLVADRLEAIQHGVEAKYFPFSESLAKVEHPEEEREVLGQFCEFAEDLVDELQSVRQTLADAIKAEECVMCLGQVYDFVAEALADYEIAGAFVERMVGDIDEAV